MQPVICHSFVSFPRNAKPKVSASFQECGDSGTWTIRSALNPHSLDNNGSCWILKDFYCSVTMLRELGLKVKQ